MTEGEWLGSVDWLALWLFALESDHLTPRKARLVAVAACRELQHLVSDNRLLRMLELAEEWADAANEPDDSWWDRRENWRDEAKRAAEVLPDRSAEWAAAWGYAGLGNHEHKVGRVLETVAAIYGCPAMINGVRPSHCLQVSRLIRESFGNPFRPVAVDPIWLTSTVVALATGIYQDRAFERLPILADALQNAGCANDDLLNHLRSDGPHVRGCWALDLVLGKS